MPRSLETDESDESDARRLFIAINVPAASRRAIEDMQERLRQIDTNHVVRWGALDGVHLTLKFLGDVPTAQIDEIAAAMQFAVYKIAPFNVAVTGLGAFPNFAKPSVIWAGVGGETQKLSALQVAIESAIVPLGYPSDARGFSPHLTLGRVRSDARRAAVGKLGEQIGQLDVGDITTWTVGAVSLMQSDLHPSGAEYTELATGALASPDAKQPHSPSP